MSAVGEGSCRPGSKPGSTPWSTEPAWSVTDRPHGLTVLSVAPSWFELLFYSEYAHTQEVGAGGEAACRSAAAPDRGQLWPSTFVAHLSHVGDDAAPVYTEREFRLYATDCRHGCILNVSMLTPLPDGSPRPYGVWVQEYNSLGAMPAAKKKTSGAAQDADDPSLLDSTDVEEAAAALGIPDDVIGAGVTKNSLGVIIACRQLPPDHNCELGFVINTLAGMRQYN